MSATRDVVRVACRREPSFVPGGLRLLFLTTTGFWQVDAVSLTGRGPPRPTSSESELLVDTPDEVADQTTKNSLIEVQSDTVQPPARTIDSREERSSRHRPASREAGVGHRPASREAGVGHRPASREAGVGHRPASRPVPSAARTIDSSDFLQISERTSAEPVTTTSDDDGVATTDDESTSKLVTQEEADKQKLEEVEAAKQKAEEQAANVKALEEAAAKQKAKEEAAKQKAEGEALKKKAETEAANKAATNTTAVAHHLVQSSKAVTDAANTAERAAETVADIAKQAKEEKAKQAVRYHLINLCHDS